MKRPFYANKLNYLFAFLVFTVDKSLDRSQINPSKLNIKINKTPFNKRYSVKALGLTSSWNALRVTANILIYLESVLIRLLMAPEKLNRSLEL